ncbi:hypothetical protein BER93_00495 [Xanthomonas fragariae]|nr:hypothetical protein BER92_00500 [Xanthomonas fragariae]AOD16886.1 hypothetical protein BER93_00495 [Xanthomonas fragariae]
MLQMYFVQHWFNLADEACERSLLDSTVLRRFIRINLGRGRVPNGTTLSSTPLARIHQPMETRAR